MADLVEMLGGGDRRSIGRVPEVVEMATGNPSFVADLVLALFRDDEIVRMRAADALEKLSAEEPHILQPHKRELMELGRTADQQEVRWHLAQMLPRLPLSRSERRELVDLFLRYLQDKSRIVRTFALQALADLAREDPSLREEVLRTVEAAASKGPPSVQSRARKLLSELEVGGDGEASATHG